MTEQGGVGGSAPRASTDPGGTEPGRPPFGKVIIQAIIQGNSVVVTVAAFAAAIVIGGLLIAFTDPVVLHAWSQFTAAPGNAFAQAWDSAAGAYAAMFEGAIINPHTVASALQYNSISAAFQTGSVSAIFDPLSETAVNATPLIFAGLSVALAFRAGLFNIGGTSQFIGGALLATWLGFGVPLPLVLHAIVVLIGAFAGGAAIGWVVGALKAWTGAHEVIVTIMLNYVMIYLLSWLLGTSAMQRPGRADLITPFIDGNAQLPHLAGPSLRINASFLIALAAAAGVWWLLQRSTIGFEFRSVGANPRAARTAGMSVTGSWVLVMTIAGGLAGLAASAVVQGTDHTLTFQSYGTYGIDAITVALLGRARPLGTVLAALLFGALHAGGVAMQGLTQTPVDIVTVIQALIVMFIAAPPLVRAMFRLRGARAAGPEQALAKGWNG
ncbi:MAG: ABC transporter permease [Nocardiopsaceae bacterium]|nr:ABC transporter permease [Nocardiopsaceae bacterium]